MSFRKCKIVELVPGKTSMVRKRLEGGGGPTDPDLLCGNCGEVLVTNSRRGLVYPMVITCFACGRVNDLNDTTEA